MDRFALILFCLVAGILLRKSGRFPKNTPQVLNGFVIYLSLPALVLVQMTNFLKTTSLNVDGLLPVLMPWLLFAVSTGFFTLLGRKLKWGSRKTGALILTAGLGNTSFVGFPILEALLGREALQIGVLIDQLGSFLVLSTVGLVVAAMASGRRLHGRILALRIMTFPPLLAILLSVGWSVTNPEGTELLMQILEKISVTLVPLALVSVGFQLDLEPAVLEKRKWPLVMGLCFKLILAPLIFVGIYSLLIPTHSLGFLVTILESAMAPMITAAVIAADFELDTELANLMVGLGTPLSLATVALWNEALKLIS